MFYRPKGQEYTTMLTTNNTPNTNENNTPVIIAGIDTTGMSPEQIKSLQSLADKCTAMAKTATDLITSDARVTRACVKLVTLCGNNHELATVALTAVYSDMLRANTPEVTAITEKTATEATEAQ
jgi:hypothetical protein